MANVFDVAKYILQKQGTMTVMKLQKLVYFSQAWSLAWVDKPLFSEPIEAWTNGPVVRALYDVHKAMRLFYIDHLILPYGDPTNLSPDEIDTIDTVLLAYGDKSAQWLSDLAHMEDPWIKAREGYAEGMPCVNEITHESMAEYYGCLSPDAPLVSNV